jgi:2-dehydropantoate 2-reductase
MRIAIIGPGAIGSVYAFQLSRAGHDVTVVGRGDRLEWLRNEGAILLKSGQRAAVTVADALDASSPWDLVLVTVLAPQVTAVLPALRACAARTVMFMFNTFESLEPLREAIGPARFAWGFSGGVFTLVVDGRIDPQIRQGSVASSPEWARVFTEAGIPTQPEPDMQSWLRSHAALVVPLMSVGSLVFSRGAGLTWAEARAHAEATVAGFAMVRALGNAVRPPALGALPHMPRWLLSAMLWGLSRTRMIRDLGARGPAEPRLLIDMMHATAPALAGPLVRVRP